MAVTLKPLMAMTAADLMTADIVKIQREMSLQTAARLLCLNQVSGAPVVDNEGRCVGMISATDFLHWAERGRGTTPTSEENCQCFYKSWGIEEPEGLPEDAVFRYMTTDIVKVRPDKSIAELARMMIDAHIHRIVVVDEEDQLLGIVASTDILAAVAYAGA